MARVYIYQTIYDLAQSEVADHLHNRPSLGHREPVQISQGVPAEDILNGLPCAVV